MGYVSIVIVYEYMYVIYLVYCVNGVILVLRFIDNKMDDDHYLM